MRFLPSSRAQTNPVIAQFASADCADYKKGSDKGMEDEVFALKKRE
jgi:hypothetical protein